MTVKALGRMEDMHPKDEGCPEATAFSRRQSKCTECPFFPKKCIHEEKQEKPPNPKHKEILMLFNHGGISVNKIARRARVSSRTVYRVIGKKE